MADDKDKAQKELSTGPQLWNHYRHYKGGEYIVVCRSVMEDSLKQLVTYQSLKTEGFWTRTVANFEEMVDVCSVCGAPVKTRVTGVMPQHKFGTPDLRECPGSLKKPRQRPRFERITE